ncbi:NADH-quinone oxidoreductase subunit G [Deinobacterium chartae]|uniref:NADH-quinone oxidoreductase n=1 Tax=Deinobacterium chartae TaxID=521158 RepID=A0A841HXL5_9DEIO|nr:NADH-quinone oxidoreductase subunit NuoG [Deinobacterium chartae]MBB6096979.1 NADH-quinone oxidoreductase subunit G [Deinobacterium chartae]
METINVIVDGREVTVPKGTSAIDAVFAAGHDVPYFCSQPYLSPIGACRMCLVEAGTPRKGPDGELIREEGGEVKIFWFPKPMASCTLMASDGMVIRSQNAAVKKAQAGMMEFTLLNHPLDCPTCDKGGACELQDRAFEYGYGQARYPFDRRHAEKHYELSEFVILDQERCIHCKRCVRYFEEIPGEEVLDFIERGGHTFIDSLEDGLPSNFSGNITDICPVGALLDNVARFRGRNWEYDHTPTTCTACPVGCSITADARNGRLERIVGRENREVNETWLCDAGRFGHEWIEEGRLSAPLVRTGGELRPASWEQVIAAMRAGLEGRDPAQLGLYTSADATLEEGIALESLAGLLGTDSVDHSPRYGVSVTATRPTLSEVAQADAVVVIGADVSEEAPVLDLRIQEMLRGGILPPAFAHGTAIADLRLVERQPRDRSRLAVFYPRETRLARHAAIRGFEPSQQVLEGLSALVSGGNALASAEVCAAAELLQKARRPVIIIGADALAQGGQLFMDVIADIAAKVGAKLLAIPAGANGYGLAHLKLVPQSGGAIFSHMHTLEAAFVSRIPSVPAEFEGFLVVHDTHLTEAARRADVVLPALSNYEKRGTTVNLEGRLLPLRQSAIDAGESADLITALSALAEALGVKPEIRGLRSARRALQQRFGLDLEALPDSGVIHPLGTPFNARSGRAQRPKVSMWKEEMLRAARIRRFVTGEEPRLEEVPAPLSTPQSPADGAPLGGAD